MTSLGQSLLRIQNSKRALHRALLKLFARSLTRYEVRVLLVERAATAKAAIVANFTASA